MRLNGALFSPSILLGNVHIFGYNCFSSTFSVGLKKFHYTALIAPTNFELFYNANELKGINLMPNQCSSLVLMDTKTYA